MFYDGKLYLFLKRLDLVAIGCSFCAFSKHSIYGLLSRGHNSNSIVKFDYNIQFLEVEIWPSKYVVIIMFKNVVYYS